MKVTYVKRIGLLRRKAGMSDQEFLDHWLNVHAELGRKLPKLRRYAVNFVDRTRFPQFGWDGFSELWFDSEEDLIASYGSAEANELMADVPNFTTEIAPLVALEFPVVGI
ncbi:hypothetical protein BYI23_D005620 (plasmid) [Burkholderia sp. YI23]|nr:hypothetical protein BYI23_D005620 [Burkholderia sp. YI23]